MSECLTVAFKMIPLLLLTSTPHYNREDSSAEVIEASAFISFLSSVISSTQRYLPAANNAILHTKMQHLRCPNRRGRCPPG